MKRFHLLGLVMALCGVLFFSAGAMGQDQQDQQDPDQNQRVFLAEIGQPAANFVLEDVDAKAVNLQDMRGKFVVLEWTNYLCPFVKKHYSTGNMQKLQKEYTDKGVVWLSICSSAPGKQGNSTPAKIKGAMKKLGAVPTHYLIDEKGEVGPVYKARNTPHMFVIDPEGVLIYRGAIDDKPSMVAEDVKGAKNYVKAALDEAMAGKKVSTPDTEPYGCSVKYADPA